MSPKKTVGVILLLFICYCNDSFAATSQFNKDSVDLLVRQFTNRLSHFAKNHCDTVVCPSLTPLLRLFESGNAAKHSFDLFENENGTSIFNYTNVINEHYGPIIMSFSEPHVFDSIQVVDGVRYAIATVSKKINYKNYQPKNVAFVIAVNVSRKPYLINAVIYPQEYWESGGTLSLDTQVEMNNRLYAEKIFAGDSLFKLRKFPQAKQIYKMSLSFKPRDAYSISQVKQCDSLVSFEQLKMTAEDYYNKGDYYSAKLYYTQLAAKGGDNVELARSKIKDCSYQLTLKYYYQQKGAGDEYFSKGLFPQAKEFYIAALTTGIETTGLNGMISQCDMNNKFNVREEILKTSVLVIKYTKANQLKDHCTELYDKFADYEPSGLLAADDYLFLSKALASNSCEIGKHLDYSNYQCNSLAKEYCKKAISMGSKKAKIYWDNVFSTKPKRGGGNFVPYSTKIRTLFTNEDDWFMVNFFVTAKIELRKEQYDKKPTITIRAGSFCRLVEIQENKLLVSFGKDDMTYLSFGPNPHLDNAYSLFATEWLSNGWGRLHYGGETYWVNKNAQNAKLIIGIIDKSKRVVKSHTAKGRKWNSR